MGFLMGLCSRPLLDSGGVCSMGACFVGGKLDAHTLGPLCGLHNPKGPKYLTIGYLGFPH